MSSAIKVLHVFPTFVPGGAQVRVTQIMNRLGKSLSNNILAIDGKTEAIARLHEDVNVRILPPPKHKTSFLAPWQFRRTILALKPDLVITYNWGAMDAVAGTRLAGICPVIHTEDGFGRDEATGLKTRRVFARRLLLSGIYRTVVPSMCLWKIATSQYGLVEKKVEFIPNGVDTNRFHPGRNLELRRSLGVGDHDVLCGYVGQIRPEKNLGFLLRAFASVQKAGMRLALIGDGPSRAELQTLACELSLDDSVLFIGAVQNPAPYYQALDLFVMSSMTEQMPMALLEAMSSALPAVCTDVGDTAAMLGGSNSVVAPDDGQRFATLVKMLMERPALRADIGQENRQRCLTNYSEDAMVGAHFRLYEAAVRTKFPVRW
jgi:glycosyltransferase involved in cell wall biosynthesis